MLQIPDDFHTGAVTWTNELVAPERSSKNMLFNHAKQLLQMLQRGSEIILKIDKESQDQVQKS